MEKSQKLIYRAVRFGVDLFYPEIRVVGAENLPPEPCIVAGNHAQINGPIAGELYFPGKHYIWCAQEMMHLKEVPDYAYQDFWSRKPKWSKGFYRLLSYLIAPLCVCIFNNAHTIPVYRDRRIIATFRDTLEKLRDGSNVVIFPEHDEPYNHILCQFQPGFVDVAKSYFKQTGKALYFVPMYLAPSLKAMYLGTPIQFDPTAPVRAERKRICDYLMDEISHMADALPRHQVIPYNNISKKEYGYNKPTEVNSYEKTGG